MNRFGFIVGLLAVILAAEATEPDTAWHGTLEPGQGYTWGINPRITLAIEPGQIITEAVLNIHNLRPDNAESESDTDTPDYQPRITGRTGPTTATPCYDDLRLYVLDNPRYGFLPLNTAAQDDDAFDDPFAEACGALAAEYMQGNLVYRLSGTHDANAWPTEMFGGFVSLVLTDETLVSLSSALLEFIDYAGTGVSVGFGIWPGDTRYYYDDITLTLTVQSYVGDKPSKTIVCRIGDKVLSEKTYTLTVSAVNGSVDISPNKPTYEDGEIVTLTAVPHAGYIFDRWSGSAAATDNPLTLTIDGHKTITANFKYQSRISQERGS